MKKKICIIILIAFGIFFSFVVKEQIRGVFDSEKKTVRWIVSWLNSYIEENRGTFPGSEQELIEKGYLEKKSSDRGNLYKIYVPDIRFDPNKKIWQPENLEFYVFRYSTSIDDLYTKDNKIYDAETNEQIFLVRGRFSKKLKHIYEKATYEIYQKMLEQSEKRGN